LSEWVQRVEQSIDALCLINNVIYTGGQSGKIYYENVNILFNGAFYPAEYRTTFINLGSNSNLKKQKTPLLLVLNNDYTNDFWVELTVDNKTKNPKRVQLKGAGGGFYGSDEEEQELQLDNETYDSAYYAEDNPYSKKVKEVSTPQTWYTMSIRIYTDTPGQGFYINSMEIKNTKEKLKTRGR
jgi:hypothetical protein